MNPYAPPGSNAPVLASSLGSRTYATRAARFGAAMIDGIAMFVVGTILSRVYAALADATPTHASAQVAMVCAMVPQWAILSMRGQTIGKLLMKIEIVKADGATAGLLHAVVLRALPIVGLQIGSVLFPRAASIVSLLLIADSLFVFSESRRCVHDRIAGTYVVMRR